VLLRVLLRSSPIMTAKMMMLFDAARCWALVAVLNGTEHKG